MLAYEVTRYGDWIAEYNQTSSANELLFKRKYFSRKAKIKIF